MKGATGARPDPRCRFHAVKRLKPEFVRRYHLGPKTGPEAKERIAKTAALMAMGARK
jgi:hypothetical protein